MGLHDCLLLVLIIGPETHEVRVFFFFPLSIQLTSLSHFNDVYQGRKASGNLLRVWICTQIAHFLYNACPLKVSIS